jgi:hypothetical protein
MNRERLTEQIRERILEEERLSGEIHNEIRLASLEGARARRARELKEDPRRIASMELNSEYAAERASTRLEELKELRERWEE